MWYSNHDAIGIMPIAEEIGEYHNNNSDHGHEGHGRDIVVFT